METINPYVFPGLPFTATVKTIETKACRIFKVPVNKLWMKTRKRPYVQARWFVSYFLYRHNDCSQSSIAHAHSFKPCTMNYAIKQLEILFETDRDLKKKYELFEDGLLTN